MTATAAAEPRPVSTHPSPVESHPVSFARVVSSEWIKFRTLRSTLGVLAAAIVGMVVIALIVAYNTRHLGPNLQPDDIVASSPLQGYYLGQLLIGALGVLFVSGEYSTGMIRSTLVAVPKRVPVLWAKLLVFLLITLVSMVVISMIAFLSAEGLLSNYRTGYSLSDPGVLRVVLGTGVYLALAGLIGSALGWIVRSTPGALVAYFGVMLVLPIIFGNVLGSWGRDIAKFMPSEAGGSFIRSLAQPDTLSPWTGLLVMVVWVVVGLAVAVVELGRRDA